MAWDYNYNVIFRHLFSGSSCTAGRCRPEKTFLLVAAFVVSLTVIGGAADAQHAGDLGQVIASEPTPYHLTGSAWSIPDLSAPQSGYAFAQTPPPDSTPPTFVSSKLNDVTGVLTITFSEAIDVTPTTNVVPAKIHVRDSGNYADSVTLTAGELGTAADAVTISFTLTDQHQVTVTGWATPELMIEPGAVRDTSGNSITSTFDVSTAAFVHSFNVSSQDTLPRGMAFSNNGAKMFVAGEQKNNINEYTLSTPFDVSTASPAHSFNVSSQDREPIGMAFSNNGAKMFVVGWADIDIYEYTLRTPFKVSTASFVHSFDVFYQDFSPRGMAFSNDGAKMFITGDQKNNIIEYTLSTPFDVSTASFDDVVFSVSDQDRKPEGMAFSSDGAKMFVVGWNNNAVNEYTLPTPFDISTASFVHSFNVSSQDTSPRGMALSNDGTKMFVVGDQKNNINEYTLSSVYPIRVTSLPAGAFVTIWKTTSTNEAITFPGRGTYTIDWGDGSSPSQNVENQQQHTYALAGNYTVSVSGDLSQIFNNCLPNAEKLISIEQWGDIRWSDMRHAFCGASQMTYDATDNPNLSSVSDMEGMFRDTSFNGDLYSWDVSSVTDMSYMFSSSSFDGDLSSWDVSSVTDMSHMFFYASDFDGDLSSWDVSSVTDMSSMFDAASDFDGDLSGWDVSSVTDMSYMFASSHFNGDISRWDVSSVTYMSYMFFYAPDFDGDLSGWDVSSVTDMHSMFLVAFDFNGDLSSWNISSVNNMSYMFSHSSFDGDLSGWDVSGVTYMEQMFQSASFNGNLGNWYITLDNASVTGILQAVGNITPQNEFLATHGPTYGIGSSSDSEHFGINGAALILTTIPDANPATVNITSTGDFGTSNSRIFEITVLSGVADTTNPRLASIERFNPTSQNTDSSSLVYKATFNESVAGVDTSDFVLSFVGGNAGTGSITGISGSGSVYYVIVSAAQDGTYNLDLVSSGHGIRDAANNLLNNTAPTTGTDHTYTVNTIPADATAPTLTSIERFNPTSQNTDSQSLIYKATFDESVTGVDTSDFVLSSVGGNAGTGSITGISGSGSVYYVTVSASQDGTYNLDLVSSGHGIEDIAENPLTNIVSTSGTDHTYTVNTVPADATAPTLASIERYNPAAENTDSQTLVYKVTFSENVTGVDTTDFTLSPGSTGNGTGSGQFTQTRTPAITIPYDQIVTDTILVTGSGTATSVSVAVDIAHQYVVDLKIDLIAPDGTVQTLHDRSSGPANIDQTYTPDFGSVSIAGNWTLQMHDDYSADDGILNSWTLTVNHDSDTATHVTSISGSGDVYYATLFAVQDGTYNLDLVSSDHGIADAAANPLTGTTPTTGTDHTYTVNTVPADATAPTLTSIERYSPAAENTDSQTLVYKVTFSENVTGVNTDDFVLSSGSTGNTTTTANSVTSISGSGSVYYATVSASTDGTYNLDLVSSDHGIADAAANPLTGTTPTTGTDHTYTVNTIPADTTAPTLASIERYSPAAENTDSQTLVYKVTFSENVTGVNTDDFVLSSGSTGNTTTTANSVTSISGSGSVYYATVSASTDGTYNLDLVSSDHGIADAAANPLTGTTPTTGTDHTYTVNTIPADTTAPTLASIERYSPAAENTDSQTLVYKVTFSENVTGVDTSDFTLSPGSTGTDSGQFTQTRTPAITIPYDQIVTDTILVTGSGTTTSVSVAVDIAHQYVVDLKIDLIAPDGTVQTLHDRSSGPANIDQTYTPDFGSVSIAGNWTLQMHDNYSADDGILNSWTLTVNHDSDTATHVTSISGSGDVYYATLFAVQDGTYNLDLVSSDHGIADAAANPLTGTTPTTGTDHTYTVNTIPADATAPTLASIERYSPTAENTDSQTLVYKVTFSENVTGVNTDDFVLSSGSTGNTTTTANSVTSISGSGSVYYATVSASTDGTYNLDLVSSDHGIADAAANPLTGTTPTTGTDHTYTVNTVPADATAPTLTSIERYSPAAENTDSQTLVYKVTFSENVTGVNTDDFVLSSGSTGNTTTTANSVTSISGSGSVYYATVSASTDGTYNLDLVSSDHGIADAAANPLTGTTPTTGTDHTYTVNTIPADTTAPTLASIERYSPAAENTDSQTLVYKVTFSENVTGVDTSDFTLSPGSTGTDSGQFTQTRTPAITIPYDQIVTDTIIVTGSGTATSVSVAVDIVHPYIDDLKIDLIVPDGTVQTLHDHSIGPDNINQTYAPDFGSVSIAGNWTLQIYDRYSADDGILNSWTLTVNHDSDTTTHVTSISGSSDVYYATLFDVQDGTYNLDLVSSGHNITDAAANPLTGTTPTTGTDHTYTVNTVPADVTAPTLASIERYDPAAENTDSQTLVYKVTFSENVTGVDTTDFTLSPDSTGGSANNTSGQFTQMQSPSLAIPDMTTVSDTIAVPDSGTATSVSVSVDIAHTWIGDLLVELIAPDDTTRTLHNREGGGVDDIDQTYTPDFGDVSIAGTWTLRIYDGFNADPGVLNSWTLTVNHDSDTATHATSISGSGDVYYVTVSATQEGTYNLDLVSSDHGITGAASNLLTDTIPTETDHTYTVSTAI